MTTERTMNTGERLKQIRTRAHDRTNSRTYTADIDFLLSLVEGQAANYTRPTGWQSVRQRADPRKVYIEFEDRECAEAFIKGIEPADGPIVAATLMRDKCVDAIKTLRAVPHGAAYNNAVNDAIHKIESLTLDQVVEKQKGIDD